VKTHWTSSADDPKQARAVGASWADAINAILTHLGLSTITSTPATVGDGLEINSSALRVKLNGSTLVRSGSGMSVNVGTGNNQIVRLDGSSKLPAVDGSALTGVLPVGSVSMFAGSSAPTGWLLCNGAAVSRTTFSALFAIIGTTYGAGNGSTTFNVPDMRGRAAIGVGQGSGLTDRALAATGGSETISSSAMPSHTHSFSATTSSDGSHQHVVQFRQGAAIGTTTEGLCANGAGSNNNGVTGPEGAHAHTVSGATGSAGSGAASGNMPPFIALNFIIKT
jgi:microcystin-dependent protein